VAAGDPGHGEQLVLSWFAYGDTEDEVDQDLARVFRNIGAACASISQEITTALNAPAR
jgi:hypothetical protein